MVASRTTTLVVVSVLTGLPSCGRPDGGDAGDGRAGDAPDGRVEASVDGGRDVSDGTDESDGPDAAPEAGPITVVLSEFRVLAERLCDLDGDGAEDNVLADLGPTTSAIAAAALDSILGAGLTKASNRGVVHVPWVEDVRTPEDPSITLVVFNGKDLDDPYDPDAAEDDFSGEEPFYVKANSLDACGEPLHFFPNGSIVDGHLEAVDGTAAVQLKESSLVITGGRVFGEVEPRGESAEIVLCGAGLIVDFGRAEGLDETGTDLSLLEVLLVGGSAFGFPALPGLAPSLDLDGDGLERLEVDEEGKITQCIDGDLTVISGRDCWQDPRMADAFALTMGMTGVGARFEGREPGWQGWVEGTCDDPPEESLFDAR